MQNYGVSSLVGGVTPGAHFSDVFYMNHDGELVSNSSTRTMRAMYSPVHSPVTCREVRAQRRWYGVRLYHHLHTGRLTQITAHSVLNTTHPIHQIAVSSGLVVRAISISPLIPWDGTASAYGCVRPGPRAGHHVPARRRKDSRHAARQRLQDGKRRLIWWYVASAPVPVPTHMACLTANSERGARRSVRAGGTPPLLQPQHGDLHQLRGLRHRHEEVSHPRRESKPLCSSHFARLTVGVGPGTSSSPQLQLGRRRQPYGHSGAGQEFWVSDVLALGSFAQNTSTRTSPQSLSPLPRLALI